MMVFNPLSLLSQQQKEELAKMQQFTGKIKYVIHTEDATNRIELSLVTDDPGAVQLLPQIREGVVSGIAEFMYTIFNMTGERL